MRVTGKRDVDLAGLQVGNVGLRMARTRKPCPKRPCRKDGRQAQPLADGRGAPDVPVLGSQPFVLSTVSARHAWHLLFVPFEFSGDAASVYLISTAEVTASAVAAKPSASEPFPGWESSRWHSARRSQADQQSHVELSFALSTRHPGGHDIRMEMRHVFMPVTCVLSGATATEATTLTRACVTTPGALHGRGAAP